MGRHGDFLHATDHRGGYCMQLVLNLGKSRKICFSANILYMNKVFSMEDSTELASD
jgi:hypothetical protein